MIRRQFPLAALLLAAAVISLVWNRLPLADGRAFLASIPLDAPGLKGRDLPLTDLERRWLAGASGIKRLYSWEGRSYILAITDGTRNRHAVHDPTYCFRGAGWRVVSRHATRSPRGWIQIVSLSRGDERTEVAFWFDDGVNAFCSPIEFWLRSTSRRLTRGATGPEPLICLLLPVANHSSPDWLDVADRLIPTLTPAKHPYRRL